VAEDLLGRSKSTETGAFASSNDNLIEELADVLEVLKALIVKQNIAEEVFKKREDKCLERGGFDNGVILIK
jgi:predicted house-cleaning noncanonical NTP pyrophosphatase (MazG superfamily)